MLLPLAVALISGAVAAGPATVAFERAEQSLAENRLEEAAAAYQQAIASKPDYAEAINGLGSVLFKQGRRDQAIAQFKKAIDADPRFKLAYFNLGYASRKSSDFDTAVRAYEKYIALDPEDPDGLYGLGESYRQLGQDAKAISAYQKFIAKETRPSEQRWVEKAREYVALLKSPGRPPVEVAAAAAATSGAGELRARPASEVLPAPPGSPQAAMALHHVAEGDRLMEEKKYRRASFAYQDAIKSDPSNVEALFKLANSEAELGYYTHAVVNWNKAMQLTTDGAVRKSAEENIARAQTKMMEVSGLPLKAGTPAPALPPTDPARGKARAAYEQGVKQIKEREYAGALQSLNQAIQLQPGLAMAYLARGSAKMGMQQHSDAVSDYQSALRLDSNLAAPLYGLGEALEAMGRPAEARDYFEKYAGSTSPDVRPELQREARQKATNCDKIRG